MGKTLNLRNKILIPIGLLVLLVSAGTILLLYNHVDSLLRQNALELAGETARRYGSEIKTAVLPALHTARTMARTFEGLQRTPGGLTPTRLDRVVRSVMEARPDLTGVWTCWMPGMVADPPEIWTAVSGQYVPYWHRFSGEITVDALSGTDRHGEELCRAVLETGQEQVSEPVRRQSRETELLQITLAVPVREGENRTGAVGVSLPLSVFDPLITAIHPFETGYGFFVSNSGITLAHPLRELLGQPTTDLVPEVHRIPIRQAIRNGETYGLYKTSLAGEKTYSYFVFTPFHISADLPPWSAAVAIPLNKVLADSRYIAFWAFVIGLTAILILILMIFALSRRIVRPLETVRDTCRALASGHFGERINLESGDEFGEMAGYINRSFDIVIDKMYWYEGMLDAIPFPVCITDMDLHWTFVNRAAESAMGTTRAALAGTDCSTWDTVLCGTGTVFHMLQKGKTGDNFYHAETDSHYQIDAAWLHNARGERIGMIEIVQDITESVRLKEQTEQRHWLRNGEAELNRVMRGELPLRELGRNIITFLCKYLDAYAGLFYLTSDAGDRLNLIASYACQKRKHLSASIEPGEGVAGQAFLEQSPILMTRVPGEYTPISSGLGAAPPHNILVVPFLFDGAVKGVVEIGAFHPFSEQETRFVEGVSHAIGVAVNTATSRTRMKELLEQTQHQAEELQVQQEELRQTNAALEQQTRALKASRESLQEQQEELRVTNEELEQRTRDLEAQRDAIREKNEALKAAQAEIQHKAKDLETTSRYKSEFMANMSHELRTPLNSILILSQILADNRGDHLTEKQREFAETIYSSGADLLSLINDILDLSKIEAGKMEMIPEENRISDLADDVRRQFQPVADQKEIGFSVRITEEIPATICTDGKRLWQVLKNLLSNAFKFTHTGEVILKIFRPSSETNFRNPGLKPETAIAFAVSDTGIGVAAEKQQIIFEAFQQADGTTSRKYGGTGLGLSISREFARALGGEIHLESVPDQGSTFTLFLPEQLPAAQAEEIIAPPAPRPSVPPEPVSPEEETEVPGQPVLVRDDRRKIQAEDKTLLIIEDDPNFASVMLDLAREREFKGLIAEDGETGLHFADYYRPSGIILDIGLPGMDGWTVMERLKQNPVTRHIPVHFISASERNMNAMKMGAVGFLSKPVTVEMLDEAFQRIEQVVSRPVKRLLVVENDAVQMRSILELIGNGDVVSHAAGTGGEALDLLRDESFDCMILDLGLEDMTGFDLLAKLRQDRTLSKIPVIIYTGKDLTRQEEAELQKYADSIIIKGVRSPERLLDETTLFLHRVAADLPGEKQEMLTRFHDRDAILADKTVLIVDDDMRNVFALGSVLEEKGIRLLEARNGIEGLTRLEQHPETDLVIMDIMMPEMDGYEAIRRIREQKAFQKLPVIALTAKAMKGDKIKCIEAGANDYLAKPVDTARLLSLLRVWLYE